MYDGDDFVEFVPPGLLHANVHDTGSSVPTELPAVDAESPSYMLGRAPSNSSDAPNAIRLLHEPWVTYVACWYVFLACQLVLTITVGKLWRVCGLHVVFRDVAITLI